MPQVMIAPMEKAKLEKSRRVVAHFKTQGPLGLGPLVKSGATCEDTACEDGTNIPMWSSPSGQCVIV